MRSVRQGSPAPSRWRHVGGDKTAAPATDHEFKLRSKVLAACGQGVQTPAAASRPSSSLTDQGKAATGRASLSKRRERIPSMAAQRRQLVPGSVTIVPAKQCRIWPW